MKILNFDPPPEQAAALAKVLSINNPAPSSALTARTRRPARSPLVSYGPRVQLSDITAACRILANQLDFAQGTDTWAQFVYDQSREILMGIFNLKYWRPQTLLSEVVMKSIPSSVPDPDPPPYSYRQQNNLPTLPDYFPGVVDAGEPRYAGHTHDGYFWDDFLAWRRLVFRLATPLSSRNDEPVFLHFTATMAINADARGSRPMTSLIAKKQFAALDGLLPNDNAPPIAGALSFYWRYKAPSDTAPFYHVDQLRNVVARLYPSRDELAAAPLSDLAVSVAPRPLFGRGFNNNMTVTIDLTTNVDIYQITRARPLAAGPRKTEHEATFDPAAGPATARMLIFSGFPGRELPVLPAVAHQDYVPPSWVPGPEMQVWIRGPAFNSPFFLIQTGAADYTAGLGGGIITYEFTGPFSGGLRPGIAHRAARVAIVHPDLTYTNSELLTDEPWWWDNTPLPAPTEYPDTYHLILEAPNQLSHRRIENGHLNAYFLNLGQWEGEIPEVYAQPGGSADNAHVYNIDPDADTYSINWKSGPTVIAWQADLPWSSSEFYQSWDTAAAYRSTTDAGADFDLRLKNDLWQYTPATDTWQSLGLITYRAWLALVAAFGGSLGSSAALSPTSATTGDTTVAMPNGNKLNFGGSIDGTEATAIDELWLLPS